MGVWGAEPVRRIAARPDLKQSGQTRSGPMGSGHADHGGPPMAERRSSAPEVSPRTPEYQRLAFAVDRLRRARPDLSAAQLFTRRQSALAALASLAAVLVLAVAPAVVHTALAALVTLAFVALTGLRLAALWHLSHGAPARASPAAPRAPTEPADSWPRYSVLVPVYREKAVAAQLVRALRALDYPPWRLEIFFITEADDPATRAAIAAACPAPNMHILTVPPGAPRTKPRALNFALTYATGDYVTVFDAEDVPEPGQLKAAVRAFRSGGTGLACVQARLDIYNARDSFFTRQFTLEYAALFGAILPAYQRLAIPIPLGGTSNHFPRAMLERAGAWDPFNVTEDADLGVRLARTGYRVAMIEAATWEEAPRSFRQWLGQRTRWIKGWMQTYIVHMRAPSRLRRELGWRGFIGFQLIWGGLVLSALLHPMFYFMAGAALVSGGFVLAPSGGWPLLLFALSAVTIAASYVSAILLSLLMARKRRARGFLLPAFALPFYWLLISLAAYRALIELVRRPHHWSKTAHGLPGRRLTRKPRPARHL